MAWIFARIWDIFGRTIPGRLVGSMLIGALGGLVCNLRASRQLYSNKTVLIIGAGWD